jgi:hypothetical protein
VTRREGDHGDEQSVDLEEWHKSVDVARNGKAPSKVDRLVAERWAREEADKVFTKQKRETSDPLEREIAESLMALAKEDGPSDHTGVWFDEQGVLNLPPVDWVVEGYLQDGGVTVIYGESGIGKTFVLLGFAKAVSRGKRWQAHSSVRGAVLFYESEGLQQLEDRLVAFNSRYGWVGKSAAPVRFVSEAVDLTSPKGLAAVIRTGRQLDALAQEQCDRLRLVVVDPLIENMSGDENSEGMDALSRGLRIIGAKLNCAVLVGHHSNASGERERGNAKLRARVLGMMRMERLPDGLIGLLAEKQRNGPRLAMELVPTEVGQSIVLEYGDQMSAEEYLRRREERIEAAKEAKRERRATSKSVKGGALLEEAIGEEPGLARDALLNKCLAKGVGKPALGEALDRLIEAGKVRVEEGARNAQLHYPA